MIDFRYHLVSLISVFLALAVGIILGAGPLQGAIGDQLQGQVDQLRSERNDLRSQLDSANATIKDTDSYIAAAGPQLIEGTLTGHRIAIIDMDAIDDSRDQALTDEFTTAGASVVAKVQLGDAWTAASAERDRKTVAGGITDLLPETTPDASPEEKLAQALVTALTQESTVTPGTLSDNAAQLGDQLEQFNLVKYESEQTAPADMILLISGDTSAPDDTSTPSASATPDSGAVDIQMTLALAAQDGAQAALVAGPTSKSGDLISSIRAKDSVAKVVSTVSGIEAEPGMISVPLALSARLSGDAGQYGFEGDATAVMPSAAASPSPSPSASSEG